MNRLTLSALGLAGMIALIAEPVAAQHRRGGEGEGNGEARGQSQQQQSQPRQQSQASQPSQPSQQAEGGQRVPGWRQQPQPAQPPASPRQQAESGQRVPGWRQQPQPAQPPASPRQQSTQPAQAPPSPPPAAPGAVPRQGFERAVPRQGFNGRYDNRRYGYAAPRYVGPRYYSGRYYGPRYVGPTFTVAPRRFYRPYYIFQPRLSVGFGIWAGYPIAYYDPFYYPYDYYPYAVATPGYIPPPVGSVSVQPDQYNMGGLSFSVSPDTAEVWVDGEFFGTVGEYTPQSQPLGLPAGTHHIELREPGFQVSSFEVDIIAGQVIPFQGQLEQ